MLCSINVVFDVPDFLLGMGKYPYSDFDTLHVDSLIRHILLVFGPTLFELLVDLGTYFGYILGDAIIQVVRVVLDPPQCGLVTARYRIPP